MTADRLQRTARWIEDVEGVNDVRVGPPYLEIFNHLFPEMFFSFETQKLRKVILEDSQGICAELNAIMNYTYEDEWANAVKGAHHFLSCFGPY